MENFNRKQSAKSKFECQNNENAALIRVCFKYNLKITLLRTKICDLYFMCYNKITIN